MNINPERLEMLRKRQKIQGSDEIAIPEVQGRGRFNSMHNQQHQEFDSHCEENDETEKETFGRFNDALSVPPTPEEGNWEEIP